MRSTATRSARSTCAVIVTVANYHDYYTLLWSLLCTIKHYYYPRCTPSQSVLYTAQPTYIAIYLYSYVPTVWPAGP